MPSIHVLPPEVANKIAAGEVVERPASVVRELLDNAIDAGATRISVEVEDGGLSLIRVTDNGSGMSEEDARICIERHATSKIETADDLECILTKGFRGEALASIAAVSKLKLITRRPEDPQASLIEIEGGKATANGPAASPPGTTVIVADLFYNTPARKKFLKRPTTEMGHICSAVTWLALAHEGIHITLVNNRRTVLELAGVSNRAERIKNLYGREIIDELLPIALDAPRASVSGFIARPTTTRNNTQHIFTFVNDRYVRNKTIHRALMDGYRNILPTGRYPVVFLYLETDARTIDINVHPTKQEVKFSNEDAIFSAVYGAVRQAWEQTADDEGPPEPTHPTVQPAPPQTPVSGAPTPHPTRPRAHAADILQATRRLLQPDAPIQKEPGQSLTQDTSASPVQAMPEPIVPEESPGETAATHTADQVDSGAIEAEEIRSDLFEVSSVDRARELVVRGQLTDSYILAEGEEGLFIIDQHAAHERILFEQFLSQSKRGSLPSQRLLFPVTIDLSPAEMETLSGSIQMFGQLGIEVEEFGPTTCAIRAMPGDLSIESVEEFLKDLLAEIENEGSSSEKRERALHTLACRAAVKFGDRLDNQTMQNIVERLRGVPRRDFCPHGRPAVVHLSERALRKVFRRG